MRRCDSWPVYFVLCGSFSYFLTALARGKPEWYLLGTSESGRRSSRGGQRRAGFIPAGCCGTAACAALQAAAAAGVRAARLETCLHFGRGPSAPGVRGERGDKGPALQAGLCRGVQAWSQGAGWGMAEESV